MCSGLHVLIVADGLAERKDVVVLRSVPILVVRDTNAYQILHLEGFTDMTIQ